MTGIEIAVGYLFNWAVRKGSRVAKRADAEFDTVLDASMDKLHTLVADKLTTDPGLRKLEQEAAAGRDQPSDRTRQRVLLALEDAAEEDPGFADALRQAVARIPSAPGASATATDGGVAAGRDIRVHAGSGSIAAVTIEGGARINPPAPAPPQG